MISFYAESITGATARGKSGPALGGANAFGLLLPLATAMCCINYRLMAAVFLGYTVVLHRVGLEKIIKNSPLGLLSPFFTVRQETYFATMSLNHLAQYYLELVISSHYRPWGQKLPPCAKRLLMRSAFSK